MGTPWEFPGFSAYDLLGTKFLELLSPFPCGLALIFRYAICEPPLSGSGGGEKRGDR
jgi:hypothetical protein